MLRLGNAAGALKRVSDVRTLLKSDPTIVQLVTLGSFTPEDRPGNPGEVFVPPLNALGLPNPGINGACALLDELGEDLIASGRTIRVSIAGFSPEDYALMTARLRPYKRIIRSIEINLGCPNVREDRKQEPIMSFNPARIDEVIRLCWEEVDTIGPSLDVKLSPYSDPFLLGEVAGVIADHGKHHRIQNLVTCNTFPNATLYESWSGQTTISANDGYAGLSGPAMKAIALGQVRQFNKLLQGIVGIVYVGGLESGQDIRDAELAGAVWGQVGLAYMRDEDPKVFERMAQEYVRDFVD